MWLFGTLQSVGEGGWAFWHRGQLFFVGSVHVLWSVINKYVVNHHCDSVQKYSVVRKMLVFLIDGICMVIRDRVFQRSVGVPEGCVCVCSSIGRPVFKF